MHDVWKESFSKDHSLAYSASCRIYSSEQKTLSSEQWLPEVGIGCRVIAFKYKSVCPPLAVSCVGTLKRRYLQCECSDYQIVGWNCSVVISSQKRKNNAGLLMEHMRLSSLLEHGKLLFTSTAKDQIDCFTVIGGWMFNRRQYMVWHLETSSTTPDLGSMEFIH